MTVEKKRRIDPTERDVENSRDELKHPHVVSKPEADIHARVGEMWSSFDIPAVWCGF